MMKRALVSVTAVLTTVGLLVGCGSQGTPQSTQGNQKLKVVATIFPAYDFARAVCRDLAEVTLLLPPGAESHSYEPTPKDILTVGDSDLFVYLGGESDSWVGTLLDSADEDVDEMKMTDCVDLKEEEEIDGMTTEGEDHAQGDDEDHVHGAGEVLEYDEHVWTSPVNAADITLSIGEEMAQIDPEHAETYQANAEDYAREILKLDEKFQDFFDGVSNKTLVFADRFPLRYFADEYDLTCYAAFPGCSTQTEPSAATIAFLTDEVKKEQLKSVYYIEFSNHLVADSIAEATGVQTALFHSCHNVSQAEIDAGVTYVSLMEQNLDMLKETMK